MMNMTRTCAFVAAPAVAADANQIRKSSDGSGRRAGRARFSAPAVLVALVLLLASASSVHAATASWTASAEKDIAGYVLQWGTASQSYTNNTDVGNTTNWTVTLAPGQYFFALRAYNTAGSYSGSSSEVPFSVIDPNAVKATTVTAPSGTVTTTTPAYQWNAVATATWYLLQVSDVTGVKVNTWYTAAQAGCASSGACGVTPAAALSVGAANAWVQTYNDGGFGPWSSAKAFTVATPVAGTVTLTAPASTVKTSRPTYIWTAAANATWYLLWVDDVTGNRINQWYTAAQVGCGAATGSCSITPTVSLAVGAAKVWVQPYSEAAGYGAWSAGRAFSVK